MHACETTKWDQPARWSAASHECNSPRADLNPTKISLALELDQTQKKYSSCGLADQSFYRCLQITTSTVHRVSFYSLPRRSDLDCHPVVRNAGPGWRIKDSQGSETTTVWIRPYIYIGSESYEATISGNVSHKVPQDEASSCLHTIWHRYQLLAPEGLTATPNWNNKETHMNESEHQK
jgi:hypothetical protein